MAKQVREIEYRISAKDTSAPVVERALRSQQALLKQARANVPHRTQADRVNRTDEQRAADNAMANQLRSLRRGEQRTSQVLRERRAKEVAEEKLFGKSLSEARREVNQKLEQEDRVIPFRPEPAPEKALRAPGKVIEPVQREKVIPFAPVRRVNRADLEQAVRDEMAVQIRTRRDEARKMRQEEMQEQARKLAEERLYGKSLAEARAFGERRARVASRTADAQGTRDRLAQQLRDQRTQERAWNEMPRLKQMQKMFGEGSTIGGIAKIGAGAGAIAGVSLAMNKIGEMASNAARNLDDYYSGMQSGHQVVAGLIEDFPVLGKAAKGLSDLLISIATKDLPNARQAEEARRENVARAAGEKQIQRDVTDVEKRLGRDAAGINAVGLATEKNAADAQLDADMKEVERIREQERAGKTGGEFKSIVLEAQALENHRARIEKAEADHSRQVEENTADHLQRVSAMRTAARVENLRATSGEHAAELAQLESALDQQIAQINRQRDTALRATSEDSDKTNINSQADAEISAAKEAHAAKAKAVEKRSADEVQAIRQSARKIELRQQGLGHTAELEQLDEELRKKSEMHKDNQQLLDAINAEGEQRRQQIIGQAAQRAHDRTTEHTVRTRDASVARNERALRQQGRSKEADELQAQNELARKLSDIEENRMRELREHKEDEAAINKRARDAAGMAQSQYGDQLEDMELQRQSRNRTGLPNAITGDTRLMKGTLPTFNDPSLEPTKRTAKAAEDTAKNTAAMKQLIDQLLRKIGGDAPMPMPS